MLKHQTIDNGGGNVTQLFSWGHGPYLGNNVSYAVNTFVTEPVRVVLPQETCESVDGRVKLVATCLTTLVVCQSASKQFLYAFGNNGMGEAGVGSKTPLLAPQLVDTSFLGGRTIAKMVVSEWFSAILTTDNTLYASGGLDCVVSTTFTHVSSTLQNGEKIVDMVVTNQALFLLSDASRLYVSIILQKL